MEEGKKLTKEKFVNGLKTFGRKALPWIAGAATLGLTAYVSYKKGSESGYSKGEIGYMNDLQDHGYIVHPGYSKDDLSFIGMDIATVKHCETEDEYVKAIAEASEYSGHKPYLDTEDELREDYRRAEHLTDFIVHN